MPSSSKFGVDDVCKILGDKREMEVVVVETQDSQRWQLGTFVKYFKRKEHKQLINVLSLEFSHTALSRLVSGPELLFHLDLSMLCWPQTLRQRPSQSARAAETPDSYYPVVQHYCLMSVKGCYTDFHVDFGGSSVWYHILWGQKTFWLIEPTCQNLKLYEEWNRSGEQNDTFFGDVVEKCHRVQLRQGVTFIIPSGWIHAVFTPQDSMVFGGNFLHTAALPMQLTVFDSERRLKVKRRYRYPYFVDMLWFTIEWFVRNATGLQFVHEPTLQALIRKHEQPSPEPVSYPQQHTSSGTEDEDEEHNHENTRLGTSDDKKEYVQQQDDTLVVNTEQIETDGESLGVLHHEQVCTTESVSVSEQCVPQEHNVHIEGVTDAHEKPFHYSDIPVHYDHKFLRSLSRYELGGMKHLYEYTRDTAIMHKAVEVVYSEAITNKQHLMTFLGRVITYIENMPKVTGDHKAETETPIAKQPEPCHSTQHKFHVTAEHKAHVKHDVLRTEVHPERAVAHKATTPKVDVQQPSVSTQPPIETSQQKAQGPVSSLHHLPRIPKKKPSDMDSRPTPGGSAFESYKWKPAIVHSNQPSLLHGHVRHPEPHYNRPVGHQVPYGRHPHYQSQQHDSSRPTPNTAHRDHDNTPPKMFRWQHRPPPFAHSNQHSDQHHHSNDRHRTSKPPIADRQRAPAPFPSSYEYHPEPRSVITRKQEPCASDRDDMAPKRTHHTDHESLSSGAQQANVISEAQAATTATHLSTNDLNNMLQFIGRATQHIHYQQHIQHDDTLNTTASPTPAPVNINVQRSTDPRLRHSNTPASYAQGTYTPTPITSSATATDTTHQSSTSPNIVDELMLLTRNLKQATSNH